MLSFRTQRKLNNVKMRYNKKLVKKIKLSEHDLFVPDVTYPKKKSASTSRMERKTW